MNARAYWSRERLEHWQFSKLKELVEHAYLNVPLYRDKYDAAGVSPKDLRTLADLMRFPTVTKQEVIAAFPMRAVARGYEINELVVSRSSGSSGSVLDIAYDSKAMITYVLAGLRMLRLGFPYRPWHKQVYVYTSPYPMSSLLGAFPMHFISTLSPPTQILREIQRQRPDLLVCYPSHLRQLLDVARAEHIKIPPLKLVSVNSEMSTQAERDAIAEELHCPVLDEYSSEELTRIAAQCMEHTYHIFEDINILETLDSSGQRTNGVGTVVGTNLHNWAMPMIRYVQNDLAQIDRCTCPCGRTFARLSNLQGRANDSFTLANGKTVSSGFLLDLTYDVVLTHRSAVKDFCLVQHAPDDVELQVVPNEWTDTISSDLVHRLANHLGQSVRISLVNNLPSTATGKRNPIINLWARKQATS